MSAKNLKLSLLAIGVAIISGCAGTSDSFDRIAGIGVVSESHSTFDNANIIKVSPSWLFRDENSRSNSVKLGARWKSNYPNHAILDFNHTSSTSGGRPVYLRITGVDINVNGKISRFKMGQTSLDDDGYNSIAKTIFTDSSNSAVIPLSLLRSMIDSPVAKLRIHTGKGYQDANFKIERAFGGQGSALLTIKEFLAKVDGKIIK